MLKFVIILGIIITAVLFSFIIAVQNVDDSEYVDTIYVDDYFLKNSDFVKKGNGSRDDPYLIENLVLKPFAEAIVVNNINVYTQFKNIEITNPTNGIVIKNSSKIYFDNIKIYNSTKNGIFLQGSNNINFENVEIYNPQERGFNFDASYLPTNTFNNLIKNSLVDNSGDTSIFVFGNKTKILDNKILHSNWRSIFVYSPLSSSVISNNYIEDSYMEGIHLIGFKNQGTVPHVERSFHQSVNVTISNNELFNIHEDGIEFQQGVSQSIISGNFIHDSLVAESHNSGHMNSIEIWKDSNQNIIEGNTIKNMGGLSERLANGIIIASSSHNIVRQNQISNVPGAGIMISWSSCCIDQMPQNNTFFENNIDNKVEIKFFNRVNKIDLSKYNYILD